MRLFVGWPLPSELASAVSERVAALRSTVPPASWIRGNLHMTFAFIGETDDPTAASLVRSMNRLTCEEQVDLRLAGVGAFPGPRRPRVLWLGLQPLEPVAHLATVVRDAIRDAGAKLDEKRFVPHVTLARTRGEWSSSDVETVASALRPFSGTAVQLDRVVLYRSRLGPRGATHEELVSAELIRSG